MRITRSHSKKGLVSARTDPRDGRVQSVQLTRRGKELRDVAKDNLLAAAEDLLETLSDAERTWLLTHLLRIL
jgi:DNA-binding MarR family transcriptional regulator